MLASFTSGFSNPHGLRINQVWSIKIRFFDNPITRSIGTPACLTTKQAGFFLSSFIPDTIGLSFLPLRGILSRPFLLSFRVLPSLFYVRCVGCYPTIFAENPTQNLHISKKMRTFVVEKFILHPYETTFIYPVRLFVDIHHPF